ncbi:MAG: hypothetical protein M1816_003367 [Peltula sp. TS41687]|nr:MAG: hypothetical protein M1816_003367 [Peltula sp. TS41687]
MGKIKKVGGPRHEATLSPVVTTFISVASTIPLPDLPALLSNFPHLWPFPRGDLYNWIPILDRFDHILELFNQEYELKSGPQTQPFARRVLHKYRDLVGPTAALSEAKYDQALDQLGFDEEGDRQLIEAILDFSRLLMQNCSSRSLYSSSSHLNDLLNTGSLSLLHATLRLTVCLAQRYHASRQRTVGSVQHVNLTLLASHYNISLDTVQRIAIPFMRSVPVVEQTASSTAVTPTPKGKEKALATDRVSGTTKVHEADFIAMIQQEGISNAKESAGDDSGEHAGRSKTGPNWEEWGHVLLSYYPSQDGSQSESRRASGQGTGSVPEGSGSTSSPSGRRASGPSQQTPLRRIHTPDQTEHPIPSVPAHSTKNDLIQEHRAGAMRILHVSSDTVRTTPVWQIMASMPSELPRETRYELLSRLRVAAALVTSRETRQKILAVRILAITNLAYIYPEQIFQTKVLQQDTDEPRRLQLAYQLAELVHPSAGGHVDVPRQLQALALGALEALAKYRTKAADVCAALNVNVNHGVLFYVIRKAVSEMTTDGDEGVNMVDEEWREALFSLLAYLPTIARTGLALVSAGLLPVLLEVLTLRSDKAERVFSKVVDFLNNFIYNVRDPFQTLANAKGLDILSALVAYEVETGFARAQKGEGIPMDTRNQQVDYEVPYFQQQSLRRLFKFVNHMMSQNGLTLDRLLRNLIDSPQLLGGLRLVLNNAKVFGSGIWSSAVEIVSNFIHNEPTSYAVIAEAGLEKAILEAVSGKSITAPNDGKTEGDRASHPPQQNDLNSRPSSASEQRQADSPSPPVEDDTDRTESEDEIILKRLPSLDGPLASGIPPAAEAIEQVAHAFGAICLNASGMKLFQRSRALESFFEVFLSPAHAACMGPDSELPKSLGNTMDELVRHHPPLKKDVVLCVTKTVVSLGRLCASRSLLHDEGAKLWVPAEGGQGRIAGGRQAVLGALSPWREDSTSVRRQPDDNADVEMTEAGSSAETEQSNVIQPTPFEDILKDTERVQRPSVAALISAMTRFLIAFFANTSASTAFIELGGAERLLDFTLLPSLPVHFNSGAASQYLSKVVHLLAEQKPHLILPSLVKRTQDVVSCLSGFSQQMEAYASFRSLCNPLHVVLEPEDRGSMNNQDLTGKSKLSGTELTKCFISVHTLLHILSEVFTKPPITQRSSHSIFNQINLADMYIQLVRSLGPLQRACVMEDITLQKVVPGPWRSSLRLGGDHRPDDVLEFFRAFVWNGRRAALGNATTNGGASTSVQSEQPSCPLHGETGKIGTDQKIKVIQYLNYQTLHYLLNQIPSSISEFHHGLGKVLVTKRLSDPYQRQNSAMVADAIANVLIEQLNNVPLENVEDSSGQEAYSIIILASISHQILEVSLDQRTQSQCLTIVLQAFQNNGGFDALRRILNHLASRLSNLAPGEAQKDSRASLTTATDIILTFYLHMVNSKTILESTQATVMASRDRARDRPDFFSPAQLLVELRLSVLSAVQPLWESDFVEKAENSTVKRLISALHTILEGDHEHGAYKRSDTVTRRTRSSIKSWKEPPERRQRLAIQGFSEDIAREALYRCNDNQNLAEDYCRFVERHRRAIRYPVPEQPSTMPPSGPQPSPSSRNADSGASRAVDSSRDDTSMPPPSTMSREQSLLNDTLSMEVDDGSADALATMTARTQGAPSDAQTPDSGAAPNMTLDNLLGNLSDLSGTTPLRQGATNGAEAQGRSETLPPAADANEVKDQSTVVRVEDLDDARIEVRQHIIDISLDVLNVHSDVTFELADLIMAAVSKAPNPESLRAEIGETIVQSIISLQMDYDFRPVGKKVAAYAHLLAILLRDKAFQDATLIELKDNLPTLLAFIKIFPDQSLEDPSPWVGNILLILEKLLAEDAQPKQIKWTPPSSGANMDPSPVIEMDEPTVSESDKTRLFESILEVLPRIGRDSTLALSVVRVLVILTRDRKAAIRLGEKRNLQRLFVMIKQLAGLTTGKLQSAFMLVLRHIIEDEDTIKQIMRSAIQAFFETRPNSRQVDTNSYVRGLSAFVLRSPELFVDVSADMVKLVKFDPNSRQQLLSLKPTEVKNGNSEGSVPVASKEESAGNEGSDGSPSDANAAQQSGLLEPSEKGKATSSDSKSLGQGTSDGVIYYLLCELLSYKEVEDKDSTAKGKDSTTEQTIKPSPDEEMTDGDNGTVSATSAPPIQSATDKSNGLPTFKADQHPIFIYRCLLLQCLSELLSSYTKTKLEFINFSRKAPLQATPSAKSKSAVLNYFLTDLIPIGTLNQSEDVSFRKRYSTSHWAISAIVSLCSKTGERYVGKDKHWSEITEELELLQVRKFVLDHCLKAYKDAIASNEAHDTKYARIMSLADLFNRMLIGTPVSGGADGNLDMLYASQKHLAKLMFEKNFIPTLTASIAEIDLNYPLAKRAVKYVLRPLKLLTQTALELSDTSSNDSVPGQSEEGEISSASSASDVGEEREETPDLFRNSTLGLFEPGREEESTSDSSEDDDNELYDDEYGDEMEYEEEVSPEDNEESSDEDGDIQNMEGLPGDVGLDVEVVLNDEAHADSEDDEPGSDEMDGEDELDPEEEMDEDDDIDGAGEEDHEWEDAEDDEGEDDEAEYDEDGNPVEDDDEETPSLHHHHHPHTHDGPVEQIIRALGGDDEEAMLEQLGENELSMDLDPDGFIEDDMQEDEDLSEQDDDEDDLEEEDDVVFDPRFDDGDIDMPNAPWVSWTGHGDDAMLSRGPHHSTTHRVPDLWSLLSGGPRESGMLVPTYRTHRPIGGNRPNDDGTHPLLQRNSEAARDGRSNPLSDFLQAVSTEGPRAILNPDLPATIINNLMNAIGQGGPALGSLRRHGGALHFHVSGSSSRAMPRDIQALIGVRRSSPGSSSTHHNDPTQAITFVPAATSGRWQDESRLLFGQDFSDKSYRLINAILSVLVPPAMEEERIQKEKQAVEEARKVQLEKERQAEEERVAQEKADAEKEEQRIAEEQRAAEANNANQEATTGVSDTPSGPEVENSSAQQEDSAGGHETDAMEGVEAAPAETSAENAEAGPSTTPAPRVRTTIRGRELDITGMDIDPEYLDALPEELREEVLMHQIAERRSQAASSGEQPTNISREFLEALPDDIREELLEQEAQDRRRREREEARRRAAATSGTTQPGGDDMDPASVLATLEPGLRQAILMEQDEDVLAQLPQEIAAEARALGSEHRLRHFIDTGRINRPRVIEETRRRQQDSPIKKTQRRTVVQMLDKAGIATLLRLMFVPQSGSARHALNGILHNVCENKQNRIETISLLLSILQDGSADIAAIDRSFAQLSLRARQSASQKLQQTPKRPQDQLPRGLCDISPLAVVQQCLATLNLLVQNNHNLQTFFLAEHDPGVGLKRTPSRKGKGKENKASKYALNSLLSLLDRKLVMESPTVMEQLSTLLNSVTQPLSVLLRKDKDANSEIAEEKDPAPGRIESDNAATTSAETTAQPMQVSDEVQIPDPGEETTLAENQTESSTTNAGPAAESSTAQDPTSKQSDSVKSKKEKTFIPPFVPDYNLRLVVNILTARECSAKTFRDTLSTISSLSAIPGAKEAFGMELLRQAQVMGQTILNDLTELVAQINNAQAITDVQGLALANFSPSSSAQAKLLRVLTALDYLFDSQRESEKSNSTGEGSPDNDSKELKKSDLLATLSNDSTFGPLWAKLSQCLSAIHEKENMLNLATILLPLIEALMVVCKNTSLKTPSAQRMVGLESPRMITEEDGERVKLEELFFRFTEEHRKILNDLVRHNPKLMSGTFSLLVKNPKVLEFDNKRNYFTRRLHTRTESRHAQPPLQLSVRRDQVFLDSFKSLYFKSGEEMKYGKLSIRFHGEEGVDAGGVTREWFQVLSRQMFNPDYALFTPVASDRTTFHPNRLSAVNPEHYMFFKFIGRIIGKALYEGRVLDCHFSRAVYKRILGKPVSVKDMETLDLDYYKSLVWMLENDITDIITETFSVETEAFGETQIVDLKENGRNIPVTEANKQEYVRLVVEYRLTGSVQEQLEHFLTGFHDIVPAELISIFNEQELELLISGLPDIDVDDWKNNTEYHNYSASSPQIQWFWRAVRSFDKEERAKLLQFVTGTSKVPLNGFKELEGMNGFSRFNIHRDYGSKERLPSSHTCFNQIDLPEYESYETLRQRVYTAMTAGSEYFGFA